MLYSLKVIHIIHSLTINPIQYKRKTEKEKKEKSYLKEEEPLVKILRRLSLGAPSRIIP